MSAVAILVEPPPGGLSRASSPSVDDRIRHADPSRQKEQIRAAIGVHPRFNGRWSPPATSEIGG